MARRNITMNPEEIHRFLATPRTLQVVTIGKDGHPHAAPMWYVLRDDEIWFRSFTKSQKIVNLMRDPRVTVLAEDGFAYSELRGVMIQGRAQLSSDPALIVGLYAEIAGRYPMVDDEVVEDLDPAAIETSFGRFAEKNTAVRVVPGRIISWDHRKIGGGY